MSTDTQWADDPAPDSETVVLRESVSNFVRWMEQRDYYVWHCELTAEQNRNLNDRLREMPTDGARQQFLAALERRVRGIDARLEPGHA